MTADYGSIGTALAIAFIAFMQVWTKWQQAKTSKTVSEIHALTNGSMTAQKKMLAEVTSQKAYITKDPMDIKAAEDALKSYLAQSAVSTIVDQKTP